MPTHDFIVADAGGTCTQWRVVQDGKITQHETSGFNAYTHSIDSWISSLTEVSGLSVSAETNIYIYAAGIDNEEQSSLVAGKLQEVFQRKVAAYSDLLGVARSLCGKDPGQVCILGTGSNACYYDGSNVNKVGASLGYILGDEGSGAYLGKLLLQKVHRSQISKEIISAFQDQFHLSIHQTIKQLYGHDHPNKYLASFAPFVLAYRNHPDVFQLIRKAFIDFFDAYYPQPFKQDLPFYFAGSIAHYFSDVLREVANERGCYIKNIIQSPIAGLVLYHQNYE